MSDWISKALADLSNTLAKKNADYKIGGEFSNFIFASDVAGIPTEKAMLSQLAIKVGRIKGLELSVECGSMEPMNESLLDSYKDLAGYAILLYAYMISDEGREPYANPL